MSTKYKIGLFVISLFFVIFQDNAYCQKKGLLFSKNKQKAINKSDEILIEKIADDELIFHFNDSTKIYQKGCNTEIWLEERNHEKWKINYQNEVWILNADLKLWFENDSVWFWQNNRKISEHKIENKQIGLSTKIFILNDNYFISQNNELRKLWKRIDKAQHWTNKSQSIDFKINDTISINIIDKHTALWRANDSVMIWQSEKPAIMNLSERTKIWSIDKNTELWKNGGEIQIWRYEQSAILWKKADSIVPIMAQDSSRLWNFKQKGYLTFINDTALKWNPVVKRLFNIGDSLYFWYDTSLQNAFAFPVFESKKTKKIAEKTRFQFTNDTIMWKIKPDTLIWRMTDKYEIWNQNKNVDSWIINDSTSVWTLNNKLRLSINGDNFEHWVVNDSTKIWEKNIQPQIAQLNDTVMIAKIDSMCSFFVVNDSISFWSINKYIKNFEPKNIEKKWCFKKGTVWQLDSATRLYMPGDKNILLRFDPQRKFLQISQNTKFHRYNDTCKISILNDSIIIWPTPKLYKIRSDEKNTKVINIENDVELWLEKDSLGFWKHDKTIRIFSVDDSIRLWGYTPLPPKKAITPPKYWSFGGNGSINFSQGYFNNWVKGGESNFTTLSILQLFAKYNKKNIKFENNAEVNLGTMKPGSAAWRKNEDKIVFNTKLGLKAYNKWYYTISADFKTQFFDGYKYPNDSVPVSAFLSPFIIEYGIGLDYSPATFFSLYLSPLTAKLTYMTDTARINQTLHGIDSDKKKRYEQGFYLKANLKYDITKEIQIDSKLNLFSNYTENPENIDLDWETNISMKINKYITSKASLHMIYDHDIDVPIIEYIDGVEKKRTGPRLQTKELFSIGFSYKF